MKSRVRWSVSLISIMLAAIGGVFLSAASARQKHVSSVQAVGTRAATTTTAASFAFSTALQLQRPLSLIFFQSGGEPEIKTDIFGNIYVTAIQGNPGGVDLWKSTDKGTTFPYLGEPDGAQDKCTTVPQCAGLGGGDDSIDVSAGGYLYVSSLWQGNVTLSTSKDG